MGKYQRDSIPRIDQVDYLYETLGWISDGATFDEIREGLIEYRKEMDRVNWVDTRNGARAKPHSSTHADSQSFWSNVRAALLELDHLGLVEHTPIPSRKEHLDAHRARRYQITSEGAQFVALMSDPCRFKGLFAQALVMAHPVLRHLIAELAQSELFIPRLHTSELRDCLRHWPELPPLLPLMQQVCEHVSITGGPDIDAERLLDVFEPGFRRLWAKPDPTQKSYAFTKSLVKIINDQLLRAITALRQVPLDVITLRSAVRLLDGVYAIDSSHALTGRTGWTIWATAEVPVDEDRIQGQSPAQRSLAEPFWFVRRTMPESTLLDQTIDATLAKSSREGGFALIHEIRSLICHRHRIHSQSFNEMLKKMHHGEIKHPTYRLFLDRGGSSDLPQSELPFVIDDCAYYLLKFMPIKEAHYAPRSQVYS